MFAAKWYGVAGVPDPSYARPAISGAEDGWNALAGVRWIMLATVLAAIGSVVLHATQRAHGTKTDTSRVVATLGSITSVLLDLPGADRASRGRHGHRPEAGRRPGAGVRAGDRLGRL